MGLMLSKAVSRAPSNINLRQRRVSQTGALVDLSILRASMRVIAPDTGNKESVSHCSDGHCRASPFIVRSSMQEITLDAGNKEPVSRCPYGCSRVSLFIAAGAKSIRCLAPYQPSRFLESRAVSVNLGKPGKKRTLNSSKLTKHKTPIPLSPPRA